jgi:PiT family inorganic phosphate transporter
MLSLPGSSTHAFLGSILGAVTIGSGWGVIFQGGVMKILISLLVSPLVGLVVGYFLTKAIYYLARYATPAINWTFRRLQIVTEVVLALSYGANDAQKSMAIMTMGLIVTRVLPDFKIPLWVIALSAGSIALGILFGGQRMLRTLGGKFYKIRPIHGFASQFSATLVILGAALLGGPASSSQVITTSILGVGSADRINQVRWITAATILESWLVTIPICALLGAGSYELLGRLTFLRFW